MRTRSVIVLLAFTLLATIVLASDKTREWQTGKLVSIEQGIPGSSPGVILPNGTGGGLVVPANYKTWIYTLETETMSYGFSEPGHGWHQRSRPFTIGNQVKFALDSRGNGFLVDESGKEFKTSIVKKAAKPAAH
jgi:hypothetical protein